MDNSIHPKEKYERNGWPSIQRPDLHPPEGWDIPLITSVERIRNHRLAPDENRLAYIKDGETLSDVYVMPAAGGWPARVTTTRGLVAYWDDEIPQWSPDGKWLAFTLEGHVHVSPADGSMPRKISDFSTGASSPRWMPDSNGLVVSVERRGADQLVLTDRDGAWPRPLTDSAEGDHWDAQPSPDGKSVAFVFRPFDDLNRLDIRIVDLASGAISLVHGLPRVRAWYPRWSPDAQWLAFISQQSGHDDLWLVRPDGSDLKQVTNLGHDVGWQAWSPDGKLIVLTVNRAGALDLATLDVGSGQLTDLRTSAGVHSNPNWAPDGSFITFEYESPVLPPDIFKLELQTKQLSQLTFSNPPALARNRLVDPEPVSYKSFDGLEIPAFLFKPVNPNGAAVMYPHGGPSAQYALEYDILAQYLIAKGYTFLAINYRGSTGYGVEFEHKNYGDWGKGDTQDCLYAARYLRTLAWIDPARLAILGGSYGGYLSICSLARDPEHLFACGIAKYGDSNLVSSWAQCKRELRLYTEIFLGHPARNRGVYEAGSPIQDVENVTKPMLILHGLLDDVVPPEASEEWVEALKRHGKTFEYKTYPNEPHGFLRRENQIDVYSRIERFLDWYLLP